MAIRTGEELLQSLRDDRLLFIDGERVGDVTTDPRFAGAAHSLAELYDMQHDPVLVERMTFRSPTSGERAGLSFIEPRSVDDLIRRRDMGKIWADATCGMFGRSPDYMNIFVTGMASVADQFGHKDKSFAENIRDYHRHIRENDVCMTHTLINPQVDRSKPVEQQDKDLAAKIVKETDAGIVIRGARMVSTLAAYSHDLVVLPSTYIATSKEAEPYAFGFSIRVDAPGLRFICRPSMIHQNAASPMDHPLSARFDETDAMAIFDDVLVPWERVFIHRDAELCNGLYNRTGIMPQIMHQFSTKNWAKSEFMMGLAFAVAKSTNQYRPAPARAGHAGRAYSMHRVLPRLYQGERGRRGTRTLGCHDPGGDAAVDGAHDVPENVRPNVRDHPAPGCGRARRGPLLRRTRGAGSGRCHDLFPGGQRRLQDAHQIVPAGLRRRGLLLRRPPAALRALLFGRPGAPRRRALCALRQGRPDRPHPRDAR